MKFKFTLALLLSAIILASSASAAVVSTTLVGGAESDSQNGGTVGTSNVLNGAPGANYATYYQDPTHKKGFDISSGSLGQSYLNQLTEYVAVSAEVLNTRTGSASASFDTKTAQPFAFTNPKGPAITTTSLNGAISAAVTKTSTDGISHADASMLAQSGADANTIGTEARLHAYEALTGVGTAVAQVSKATATASALYGTGNYSKSSVAGDIKLTASNADDSALATDGGAATGLANIESASYESSKGVGAGMTDETMILHANRGASYTGKSYADGYLNGQEFTESQWLNAGMGTTDDDHHNGHKGFTATPIVDLESTSQITGSVVALNIRDIADMSAWLRPVAYTREDGSDRAYVDWNAVATAVRDTPYDGTLKVEANGFMPIATWIASATTSSGAFQHLALVKGMQGAAWDGAPALNPGFGVGAWILNPYNPTQSAQMEATQEADTQPATGIARTTFTMTLKGMSTITGTQKDAVGAFGAVANQYVQIKRTDVPFVKGATKDMDIISYAPKLLDTNAINWLVGDNANLYPGAGKVSPVYMQFSSAGTNAITRVANLTFPQTK